MRCGGRALCVRVVLQFGRLLQLFGIQEHPAGLLRPNGPNSRPNGPNSRSRTQPTTRQRGERREEREERRGERRGESNDNRDRKATRPELPCGPFAATDGELLSRKENKRLANSVSIDRKVCTSRRCTACQQAQSANCRAWKIKDARARVLTSVSQEAAYLDD